MSEENKSVVARARQFAFIAHATHLRKWSKLPYFTHLEEVAAWISLYLMGNQTAAAVAYLHDTLEDTDTTEGQIEDLFGGEILRDVLALTDKLTPEDGNRAFRKQQRLIHLAGSSPRVQSVRVADLISNALGIYMHDFQFSVVYFREMLDLLIALDHADSNLRQVGFNIWERFNSRYGNE